MSDPFVAEIRLFAFSFPPTGWAFCDGQLQPISQNTALFSLLGTFYGGDGESTFALPDLQGRAPLHAGPRPGGAESFLGQTDGAETVTLLESEIPAHTHLLQAAGAVPAEQAAPAPARVLAQSTGGVAYHTPSTPLVSMAVEAAPPTGGDLPHDNMQPYLTLNFCIALQGIFPQRP